MTTKQLEKLDWKLVEGATGNIHSACYDVKTQNCFVRFGYGDTDDGVTGYRRLSRRRKRGLQGVGKDVSRTRAER